MTSPQLFKIFGHYAESPGTGLLVLVALFGGLFFWESRLHTRAWAFVWKLASVVIVLYVVGDILAQPLETASTRVVKHAANLSLFLQLLKLYNRKTARDYKQMYLISFFQFVSCTTLTTSFGFFFLFGLYVLVALWTLSLFHIRDQVEHFKAYRLLPRVVEHGGTPFFGRASGVSSALGRRPILGPGYFAATFALALVILLTAFGMFFLFPRQQVAGQSELLGRFRIGRATMGLSGEIDLDRYGRIFEDRETVMKVTLPYVPYVPEKVLWRARALACFDGVRWQEGPPGLVAPDSRLTKPLRVDAPQAGFYRPDYEYTPSRYRDLEAEKLQTHAEIWEQRVFVEPGHALFLVAATSPPVLIDSDRSFTVEPMATFRFVGPPDMPVSYTVHSEFTPPSEHTLLRASAVTDKEDPDGRVRAFYLASTPLSAKSKALLENEIRIADYATAYGKIKAIKAYLEDNYTYALEIERAAEGVDPIENFLVHTKRGHCEYFASAMALMLQESGIPARVVLGYMTTQENWKKFFGGYFKIRQQDAHAWVEAALVIDGEIQWVPFDPSPRQALTPPPASAIGRFFLGVSEFFEALKTRWHESVIAFNRQHQHDIAETLEKTLREMRRSAIANLHAVWGRIRWVWARLTRTRVTAALTPIALACFLVAGALLIHRRVMRWLRFRRAYIENRPEKQLHSVRFYERMLRALLQHDIVKPAAQTPREFVGAFDGRDRLQSVIEGLTSLYYAVRFGHAQLTGTQIRWVHEALETLRRSLGARGTGIERA